MQFYAISNIYVNIGNLASSQCIHHFFETNSALLRSAGIYYPKNPASFTLYAQHGHYFLTHVALTSPNCLKRELETLMASDMPKTVDKHATLILSCPFFFRRNEALPVFTQALSHCFPNATVHYFASLPTQYSEIEAYYAFINLWSSWDLKRAMFGLHDNDKRNLNYNMQMQAVLQHIDANLLRVHVSVDRTVDTALEDFLSYIGMDTANLQKEGINLAPPPYYLDSLPVEFICFCGHINALRTDALPPAGLVPWSTQAPHFQPPQGLVVPSLLGPELRLRIHEYYAESNAALLRRLGSNTAFVAPPDEPDWHEVVECSPEVAFQMAQKLDRKFAKTLWPLFEAVKHRPSTHHYYCCRTALHCSLYGQEILQVTPKKVSVLTLAYNQEAYIAACIESVLAQKTSFPIEHIIVDDSSTDATSDIIAAYATKYDHIRNIHMQCRGRGDNVHVLFSACKSEYAALCDGDDYFTDPHKLQKQADYLDAHPDCGLCFHPVQVVYEDGSGRGRVHPSPKQLPRGVRPFYYISDLFKTNFIQTNSAMYRWRFRSGLPKWFQASLVPGDWYWHLLHAEIGKIGFLQEVMSVYRRHEKSLYYSSENSKDPVQHRLVHGFKELETYEAVNTHFNRHFESTLIQLANSVLTDFLKHSIETGDNSYLHAAGEKFPLFVGCFLNKIKTQHGKKVHQNSIANKN